MSKGDEHIKELLKATKEHDGMYAIVDKNKILVKYTGEEMDDMEDIPDWQYLMSAVEKVYEEFEEDIEDANVDWDVFDYGPSRFMIWGGIVDFIKGINEQVEINA